MCSLLEKQTELGFKGKVLVAWKEGNSAVICRDGGVKEDKQPVASLDSAPEGSQVLMFPLCGHYIVQRTHTVFCVITAFISSGR